MKNRELVCNIFSADFYNLTTQTKLKNTYRHWSLGTNDLARLTAKLWQALYYKAVPKINSCTASQLFTSKTERNNLYFLKYKYSVPTL